jgi:hypothetical protein
MRCLGNQKIVQRSGDMKRKIFSFDFTVINKYIIETNNQHFIEYEDTNSGLLFMLRILYSNISVKKQFLVYNTIHRRTHMPGRISRNERAPRCNNDIMSFRG